MFTYKKPATLLLHFALLTILLGACVTHFFGEQGEIHLRADKAQTLHHTSSLPFREGSGLDSSISLFLWDFQIVSDADGNPVDYITELRLLDRGGSNVKSGELKVDNGLIRMNKPLKYKGFRFCQSDYDSDEMGVVLAYNYDPWGIGITYTGYALLLIAMIAFFFQKHTRFRALWQSLTSDSPILGRVGVGLLAVLIIALAIIMTKVVTPKPPLQPVLQTPLLGIHVSVIMLAYTLFAVIMMNGILGIYAYLTARKADVLRKEKLSLFNSQLSTLSQILLYPAEFCLTAGIFIGAVWANMSWGRYWGWDPKETWALVTMLVYALLLHRPFMNIKTVTKQRELLIWHICAITAFIFVLFTYFGVSYLLGGLHSYK